MWTAVKETNMEVIFAVMNTTQVLVKVRPEKKFRSYGIWTHDPCDTGAKSTVVLGTTLSSNENYFHYYLSRVHNCEDCFYIRFFNRSSHNYVSFIYLQSLIHHFTGNLVPTECPAPSWLVSSVGRALHGYRRGHGFQSHTGLNFFSGLVYNTTQVLFITTRIASILEPSYIFKLRTNLYKLLRFNVPFLDTIVTWSTEQIFAFESQWLNTIIVRRF